MTREYAMNLVNRAAVILWPLPPLITWINQRDRDFELTLEQLREEPTAYLLSDFAADNMEEELQRVYQVIWLEQLRGYYKNARLPRRRSYEDFLEWFEPQLLSMVVDTEGAPLLREPL